MSTIKYGGVTLRRIPSWPWYAAGDDGHIYRVEPRGGCMDHLPLPYRLKPRVDPQHGYLVVSVYRRNPDGTRKLSIKCVHALVAESWHGPRPEGNEVNHKDLNRWNCRPDNLEWTTQLGNLTHAGTAPRLTDDEVRALRAAVAAGASTRSQADKYGVSVRHAYEVAVKKKRKNVPAAA